MVAGGHLRLSPRGILQQGEVLRPRVQPGVHPYLSLVPEERLREGVDRIFLRAQQKGQSSFLFSGFRYFSRPNSSF